MGIPFGEIRLAKIPQGGGGTCRQDGTALRLVWCFDLYGGIRGFRKIARDEVVDLSPRELDFMCRALNIKVTDTKCYKQAQSRRQHLGY